MSSANDMIDPVTNKILEINSKILDKNIWLGEPNIVTEALNNVKENNVNKNLIFLVEEFTKISDKKLIINNKVKLEQDFIFTLGYALNKDGTAKDELIDRLKTTLKAFSLNPNAIILVSGNSEKSGVKESIFMKQWLINNNVPTSSIVTEEISCDTVENLQYSIPILVKNKAKNVLLITGSEHMNRAYKLFEAYLKHYNIDINLSHLAHKEEMTLHQAKLNEKNENFLLFKDLGRILNIWKYQEWKIPTINVTEVTENVIKKKLTF